MFQLAENFNPIILDSILILFLLFSVIFSFVRGLKKTLIDLLLKIFSFVLAFSSILNFIKVFISEILVSIFGKILIFSDPTLSFSLGLLTAFLSSIILYFIIYCLTKIIIFVFKKIFKIKKTKKKFILRPFASLLSVTITSMILIFFILVSNNPLIGLNTKYQETNIISKIVENEEYLNFLDFRKIVPILISGNIINTKISNEDASKYETAYLRAITMIPDTEAYYFQILDGETFDSPTTTINAYEMANDIAIYLDIAEKARFANPYIAREAEYYIDVLIGYLPENTVITVSDELAESVLLNMDKLDIKEQSQLSLKQLIGR